MKSFLTVSALALSLSTLALAKPAANDNSLVKNPLVENPELYKMPASCETLAWQLVRTLSDVEAYASATVLSDYMISVYPTETAIYEISFRDDSDEDYCIIEKLEAFYR